MLREGSEAVKVSIVAYFVVSNTQRRRIHVSMRARRRPPSLILIDWLRFLFCAFPHCEWVRGMGYANFAVRAFPSYSFKLSLLIGLPINLRRKRRSNRCNPF